MGACLDAGMELAKAYKDTPTDYARQQRAEQDFISKCVTMMPSALSGNLPATPSTGLSFMPTSPTTATTAVPVASSQTSTYLIIGAAALGLILLTRK